MESFWKMEIESLTSTVDLSAAVQTTIVQSRISCWCDLLFLIISFNNDVIYSSVVRHCGHHPIQGELLHLLCLASLKKGYHARCEDLQKKVVPVAGNTFNFLGRASMIYF